MHTTSKQALLFTALLLASATPSVAGLNRWTSSGPEGASITSVVTDAADPDVVYAGTEGGGVFRSIGRGEPRWVRVGDDLPEAAITALAIDSGSPSSLFVGTSSGRVFKSVNRGDNWTEVEKPKSGSVRGFAIDLPRRRMYMATDSGVLASSDGGTSWRVLPQLAQAVGSIAVSANGSLFAVLVSGREFYVSRDSGESWSLVASIRSAVLVVADPYRSAVYVAHQSGISLSTDDGANWPTVIPSPGVITALVPHLTGLYAGTTSNVHFFDHGRAVWTQVGGNLGHHVRSFAVLQSSTRSILAGTSTGMFTALNGSPVWKSANNGLVAAVVTDLATGADDEAYAVTIEGLFRTRDAGASWQKTPGLVTPPRYVDTDGRDTVYVSGQRGLSSSTDRGDSWQVVSPRAYSTFSASDTTPGTIYGQLNEAFSKSTDGGRTWQAAQIGIDQDFYYGVSAEIVETDSEDPSAAYVANWYGLYKTSNGGESWQRLLARKYPEAISAVASRGALVHASLDLRRGPYDPSPYGEARPPGIMTSLDGGKNWSDLRLVGESVRAIVIDPHDPSRSYAGTASGRVYRSDDFGAGWHLFSEGLRGSPVNRLEMSKSGQRIYAATSGGVFVYEVGPTVAFERLTDDPLRLPRLVRQLLPNLPGPTSGAEAGFILPAVGTVRGATGTVFRTDVTLANQRTTEQNLTVFFLPQGNTRGALVPTYRVTLPPSSDLGGGILTIADIATEMGLPDGLGALFVVATNQAGELDPAADIDGFARVRSASPCSAGAVSQSFSAARIQASGSRQRGRALGLRHEAGYRTNVGVVNLSEVARDFTVVVGGQRQVERFTVSVPAFSPMQTAVPDRNYGSIAVTVISDGAPSPWVAYGSSVDNASGDAWSATAKALPNR